MEKPQFTEKVKVIEAEIDGNQVDLRAINSKLEIAYKYEAELLLRLESARKNTEDLRNQYFAKSTEVAKGYQKMKDAFDIWTGFFFNR